MAYAAKGLQFETFAQLNDIKVYASRWPATAPLD